MLNMETMESQFSGAYREAFDGAYKYTVFSRFSAEYTEEKMAELYDLLLTAQSEGKPASMIVGEDIEAFCKEYFSDYEPENKLADFAGSIFAVALTALLFALFDWLTAEGSPAFSQYRLNTSPVICGICGGLLLGGLMRLMKPLVMKSKKIGAGAWALIYLGLFAVVIGVCAGIFGDRFPSIPMLPVVLTSAAYVVLYLLVTSVLRYRKTGSLRRPKKASPYKDSYYTQLEDKDLRRFIEKGWLKRWQKKQKRGMAEADFRGEIAKLEKFNGISNKVVDAMFIVIPAIAVILVAKDSALSDTLLFAGILTVVEYFVWKLLHKANLENAALRAHILADAEQSGLTLPAFLAQELSDAKTADECA